MQTKDKIKEILSKKFNIHHLEIIDDSAKHAHHVGAKETGGGHFGVLIVSNDFKDKSALQRHRLINDALFSELKTEIHALTIKVFTPDQYPN